MANDKLIEWAVTTIREQDELCRGAVPGYGPLDSQDMERLKRLQGLITGDYDPDAVIEEIVGLLQLAKLMLKRGMGSIHALELHQALDTFEQLEGGLDDLIKKGRP